MRKNIALSLFILLTSLLTTVGYGQTSTQKFINHPALKHASVGISVVDMTTGKQLVEYDADKSLTPASVLKLITTATALEVLGENYRYKTDVALDADDPSRILIIGSGDPTLASEAFQTNPNLFFTTVVDALKKTLSPNQEYTLYVVDNLFGYNGISPEWTWIDMGNYYAAGAYGISVYDNSYRLFFTTTDQNTTPRILRTEPQMKGLTFQNELKLNNTGADNGYIYGVPFSLERTVRGNIPAGRTEFSIKGDIPNPGLLLGETMSTYLKQAGIKIGKVETAREEYLVRFSTPQAKQPYRVGQVLFSSVSPPLKDIVREVNVESNNHFAEHLIRTIGRHKNDDIYADALEGGISFITKYWASKGIETTSLQLFDGCGLAPQNAVSTQFLTDLLVYMHQQSAFSSPFFNSRTDFDLSQHEKYSGKKLQYFDPELNKSYVPFVVETSIGVDRMFLSILAASYCEEELEGGDSRVLLKLPPALAPVKLAILPLVKKDGLPERAREIMNDLKFSFACQYDEKDSIGKRYRRQDAIGTPFCATIDHQTLEDNSVTIRYRDTMEQERVSIESLQRTIADKTDTKNLLKQLSA